MAGEVIVLGKDVSYTGISNVREGTITTTYGEADITNEYGIVIGGCYVNESEVCDYE